MSSRDDFYEDDEPVEQVVRTFDEGEKGLTGQRSWGRTDYLKLPEIRGISRISSATNLSTRELAGN